MKHFQLELGFFICHFIQCIPFLQIDSILMYTRNIVLWQRNQQTNLLKSWGSFPSSMLVSLGHISVLIRESLLLLSRYILTSISIVFFCCSFFFLHLYHKGSFIWSKGFSYDMASWDYIYTWFLHLNHGIWLFVKETHLGFSTGIGRPQRFIGCATLPLSVNISSFVLFLNWVVDLVLYFSLLIRC